jgi:hypothetical protein
MKPTQPPPTKESIKSIIRLKKEIIKELKEEIELYEKQLKEMKK